MAWVRIDDHFYDHPKWATAPGDSIALWLAAMAWCNRNESWEGYIPAVKLAGLVNIRNVKRSTADLVQRHAFVAEGDGYQIHEYADYQQNLKVRRIAEARSEAGRKGAESRWGKDGKPMANAIANEVAIVTSPECPTTHHPPPNNVNTPPTTTTSHCDLPSAVAVVKAIVDVEFEQSGGARKQHPNPYRAGIMRRVRGEYDVPIASALTANPQARPYDLAAAVLNGHPQRADILEALAEADQ